MHIFLVIKI